MVVRKKQRRLVFQTLESRRVLAAYVLEVAPNEDAGEALVQLIRQANATPESDTIELAAGLYRLPAGQSNGVEVSTGIKLVGQGRGETQIVAPDGQRMFFVSEHGDLQLENLTLHGGEADSGGVVLNEGRLSITDAVVLAGTAKQGGQLFNAGSISLENTALVGGQAFEGGAIYNAGMLVTDSSLFVGNQAHVGMGGGGAVYNDGDAAFNRSLFTQNESSYVGGAISSAGTLRMADSVVTANTASRGGGIAELENAALELSGSIVAGNQAASDSLGHDIATMQRGVEGTMSSPLTSYSGQLSDVEDWLEPLAAALPGWDFPTVGDLATAMQNLLMADGSFELPILTTRTVAWSSVAAQSAGLPGSQGTIGYHGYQLHLDPLELAESPSGMLAWEQVVLEAAASAASGTVEIVQADYGALARTSLLYTPPEHFVGTDIVTIVATDANGQTVTGFIHIDVNDDRVATLVSETAESMDGHISVAIQVLDNGDTVDIDQFSLTLTYDPSVVRYVSGGSIGESFAVGARLESYPAWGGLPARVTLRGASVGEVQALLATVWFERVAPGDPMVVIAPEYDWALASDSRPLSPQSVDIVYRQAESSQQEETNASAEDDLSTAYPDASNRFDVNADGLVSPFDALIVLNRVREIRLSDAEDSSEGFDGADSARLDVNGDSIITPLDALLVLNELSRRAGNRAEPESSDEAAAELAVPASALADPENSLLSTTARDNATFEVNRVNVDKVLASDQPAFAENLNLGGHLGPILAPAVKEDGMTSGAVDWLDSQRFETFIGNTIGATHR